MSNEVFNPDLIEPEKDTPEIDTENDDNDSEDPSKKGFFASIGAFFSDTRTRILIGTILGLLGMYLGVILGSYMQHAPADQSVIAAKGSIEIAKEAAAPVVGNNGGSLGAKISEAFINKGIGVSSFFIVVWLVLMSLSVYHIKRFNFFKTTFATIMAIIATTLLTGYLNIQILTPFNWGGLCGREVNLFLLKFVGNIGTISIIIVALLILALIWLNSIIALVKKFISLFPQKVTGDVDDEDEENENETSENEQPLANNSGFMPENPQDSGDEQPDEPRTQRNITDFQPTDSEIEDNPATTTTPEIDGDGIETTVVVPEIETAETLNGGNYDPTKELSHYKFPPIDLLKVRSTNAHNIDLEEQENNKKRITETLLNYGIPIKKIEVCVGPTVTLFEIIPDDGVRISKIKNLENDIALSLAALGIRIIAPIPGKGTIGIEVPNHDPQVVSMRSIIESKKYQECKYELPMAIGCSITNEVFIADLCKMPHILVAGATGQGKSVGLNAIITSLIYRKHPAELKFVLIDPKMVEFSLYSKLEHHYLAKLPDEEEAIITDPKKVVATLNSLTVEMDNRYALLKKAGARNIQEYNEKFISRRLNPEKGHRFLPYIVLIVDEFADLIMTSGKEVETPIARIAQKARAIGIHMIIATQRPSTDVITGMIKANFPGRIAFRVAQMVDSRTILDCPGAQQLIGRGDMLFLQNGEMERLQCALIETSEVEAICDHIDHQLGYESAYLLPEYIPDTDTDNGGAYGTTFDKDPLFDEAAEFVVTSGTASTSSLQRRYSIGYNRAGKIMDQMEAAGIVGPSQGGKPRQVLIDSIQLTQILGK